MGRRKGRAEDMFKIEMSRTDWKRIVKAAFAQGDDYQLQGSHAAASHIRELGGYIKERLAEEPS